MPVPKKLPIRVLLIKGNPDFDDIVEEPASLQNKSFTTPQAKLFWKFRPDTTPTWVSTLFPSDQTIARALKTKSIAAVLLIKVDGNTYALTFGYGKVLLKQSMLESHFGLKVVLNRINPESLRSIDTKSLDGQLSHTHKLPSLSPMSNFGINIEKDFLKAVTGTSQDPSIGITISGADSFASSIPLSLGALPDVLRRLKSAYDDRAYLQNFAFVDNIAEVPKTQCELLDDRLIEEIVSRHFDNVWLAPPEIMSWEHHGGFAFKKGRSAVVYDDIGLRYYLNDRIGDVSTLTIDKLKTHKVFQLSESFEVEKESWPVYKCLYAEVRDGSKLYVLTDGKWFEVNENYVQKVDEELDRDLDDWQGIAFPDYESGIMSIPVIVDGQTLKGEAKYNAMVAQENGYTLMDRKTVVHGGANSKFEICDLLSGDTYIHVKRYTRSSGLSHLFNQGQVSAELIRADTEFREKAARKIRESSGTTSLTSAKPDMSQIHVVFGIVSGSPGALKLPFFSKVALKNAANFLKNTLDVGKVSLVKIQATDVTDE